MDTEQQNSATTKQTSTNQKINADKKKDNFCVYLQKILNLRAILHPWVAQTAKNKKGLTG